VTKHEESLPHHLGRAQQRVLDSTNARTIISTVTSYVSEIEFWHADNSAVQNSLPAPLDPHTHFIPLPCPHPLAPKKEEVFCRAVRVWHLAYLTCLACWLDQCVKVLSTSDSVVYLGLVSNRRSNVTLAHEIRIHWNPCRISLIAALPLRRCYEPRPKLALIGALI